MTFRTTGTTQRRSGPGPRRRSVVALTLLAVLADPMPLAAQTATGAPEPDRSGGTLDGLLRSFQLKARPSTAPDFVEKTRPPSTDFIPVGRPHVERPVKPMTAAEVEATTQALDKARLSQQQRAGVKPPPVPLKQPRDAPAAGKSKDR